MRSLPQKVVEGLPTTSAKIRALAAAGFSRTEIAQFLKIRYQHVRNVLVQAGIGGGLLGKAPRRQAKSSSRDLEAWPIERLLAAGFKIVGQCRSTGSDAFEFSEQSPRDAGVYAFAVDGKVTYIGLSRAGVQITMNQYANGHVGQRTRARVKGLILECLAQGQEVSILVAHPPLLEWNGLPVESAPGLEAGLIGLIRPPWNIQGAI